MTEPQPFLDFYLIFYEAAAVSEANALFYERIYGKNLCQQGFAEMAHLDHLIEVTGIQAGQQVLNFGCGNGVSYAYENGLHGRYLYRVDLTT